MRYFTDASELLGQELGMNGDIQFGLNHWDRGIHIEIEKQHDQKSLDKLNFLCWC